MVPIVTLMASYLDKGTTTGGLLCASAAAVTTRSTAMVFIRRIPRSGFGTNWDQLRFSAGYKSLILWWPGTELNRRRQPFQGRLLPLFFTVNPFVIRKNRNPKARKTPSEL